MTLTDPSSSSAMHLNFPPSTGSGVMHSRSITGVHVHPVALFSILDHFLRRNDGQQRVIGTLLGTRTESEIEIKNCFAVPHLENEEQGQVQVDMEYHRNMYELAQKVRPDEVIVGWYATSPELNTYSALIQDFYSRETAPHQAVHLTMDTSVDGSKASGLGVRSYVSSPLGASPKAENCVFLPLPTTLLYSAPEHSSLNLLSSTSISSPLSDMEALAASLKQVQSQLDRVLGYVRSVLSGERQGDKAVGRYLMDTLSVVPAGMDDTKLETLFNTHLQDVLMVSYLANVVRAQAEISSRLTLLT
ncbi:eukaryotic translation initiation factor 3 subunit F [Violaceomyces palustris]|uniref:Eukaryotic translation initiation factor 3 subunit F n=1 Tax=Violaceomyces palustris TaxID=1673888 RepID=A0ACD0NWG1_9BASI|nr:eukaryotic translation initiation factor 3 subunit F [Violaceomyces palustris]